MSVDVNRITNARVMFQYGLDNSTFAPGAQAVFDHTHIPQRVQTAQQTITSGDVLDISPQARALYEAGKNSDESIAWEQTRKKTYEEDTNRLTWENTRREVIQSGSNSIAYEHTQRKILNLSDEAITWEQTHRQVVNSGDNSISWEQTERRSPNPDRNSVTWQQTRRKTVSLGDDIIDLEQARKEVFDSETTTEDQNLEKRKALKSGDVSASDAQNQNFYLEQASTAYLYGVSRETAYQMNLSGSAKQQPLFNLFV
jgi:hypothetical protein